MKKVSTTRMELLARKAQIALAAQARDLLEKKRTALMRELLQEADIALERSDVLQQAAADAHRALARANATAGPEAVRSAALASRARLSLQVDTANVMGVRVPRIEQKSVARSVLGRGYSLAGTSITIDEAASAFEVKVDAIIRLAESELRLTRLAAEIQQTSRRLNALDYMLIPNLKGECDYIKVALDERERSERFRLKLAKRLLERRRSLQHRARPRQRAARVAGRKPPGCHRSDRHSPLHHRWASNRGCTGEHPPSRPGRADLSQVCHSFTALSQRL
jgi:V/A-type H+-transporting ATPase subunit D